MKINYMSVHLLALSEVLCNVFKTGRDYELLFLQVH